MSSIINFKEKTFIVGEGVLSSDSPIIISSLIPNQIIIVENNNAKYKIEKSGYKTSSGLIKGIDLQQSVDIPLYKLYKFTINPTPSDSNIILIADGFTQEGNSIWVTEGTKITYYVIPFNSEYKKITGTYTVTSDDKNNIVLPVSSETNMYTVTIKPILSPPIENETANVYISCSNPSYIQNDNSIVIPYDNETTILYTVSKKDYETIKESYKLNKDRNENINVIIKKFYNVSIRALLNTTPDINNNANIQIIINNAQEFKPNYYYDVKSLISYNGNYYNCIEAHTSNNNFDSSKWKLINRENNVNEYNFWVTNGTSITYIITHDGYTSINKTITINNTTNITETITDLKLFCTEDDVNNLFIMESNEIYLQEENYE